VDIGTIEARESQRAGLTLSRAQCERELVANQEVAGQVAAKVLRVQESVRNTKELEHQAEGLHQTAILLRDQMVLQKAQYLEEQIGQLQFRRAGAQTRIQELEGLLVKTSQDLETHKRVGVAFSGEVRNLMFDLIRGPLEEWTHHYIGLLLDTGIQVQFPHQDVREKFEIVVWNGQHAQELSRYSGGELWRITIAILLAFRKVLAQQQNCKLDFLLMDDFAGELDNEGVANALQVLGQLTREDIGTVLMTIPREEFLPAGRYNHLVVTKQGGQSSVTTS
jgi:DNA repair exonuclease SbcCD ATPase subunit